MTAEGAVISTRLAIARSLRHTGSEIHEGLRDLLGPCGTSRGQARAHDNHVVGSSRQPRPDDPKRLAQSTLPSIADNSVSDAPRYGKTNSRL